MNSSISFTVIDVTSPARTGQTTAGRRLSVQTPLLDNANAVLRLAVAAQRPRLTAGPELSVWTAPAQDGQAGNHSALGVTQYTPGTNRAVSAM